MSYKDLEIWQLAEEVAIEIHLMSFKLPKFEMYEAGAQIRRSSKTTKSCIVEGYGRRKYKADFLKYLIYSLSSNDETTDHLETLFKTKSLTDKVIYDTVYNKLIILGKKINLFIKGLDNTDWH